MQAAKLLNELEAQRVELWIEDGNLRYRSTAGGLTETLRRSVRANKAELMDLLRDTERVVSASINRVCSDDDLPPTPAQAWYLSTFDPRNHDWAVSLVLEYPGRVSAELFERAANRVIARHDVFRLRFVPDPLGRWRLLRIPAAEEVPLLRHDMTAHAEGQRHTVLHDIGFELRRSLDIQRGPVVAVALCTCQGADTDKILLSLHHHMVDGYSLRMFVGELLRLYQDMVEGCEPRLPEAASSYRDYLVSLHEHTQQPAFVREALAFWRTPGQLDGSTSLPCDFVNGRHTDRNTRQLYTVLDATLMQQLRAVGVNRGAFLHELLLYALSQSLHAWTGKHFFRLDVEHHGRNCLPGVNLLKTLGPMTIKFPLLVDANCKDGAAIETLCATVRATMDHGLGYGFLRYCSGDEDIRASLSTQMPVQIFFNNRIGLAPGGAGRGPSVRMWGMRFPARTEQENLISYDLMVECDGNRDVAAVKWVYSGALHRDETIRSLAGNFVAALRALT